MEANDFTPTEITTLSTWNAKATIPALMANGLEISGGSTISGPCDPHLKGKQTHKKICKMMVTRADCALDHVFLDIHKLLATQTQNGCKRLLTFSDMYKLLATQTQNGHKNLVTFVDNHTCEESIHGPHDKLQVGQALNALIF
jgi:hypothetical protein